LQTEGVPVLADAYRILLVSDSVSPEDTARLFAAADADGNGRIDLRELMRAIARMAPVDEPLARSLDAALDTMALLAANPVACAKSRSHY
jgi:Ca2+-binding EF-hand superfamily protein